MDFRLLLWTSRLCSPRTQLIFRPPFRHEQRRTLRLYDAATTAFVVGKHRIKNYVKYERTRPTKATIRYIKWVEESEAPAQLQDGSKSGVGAVTNVIVPAEAKKDGGEPKDNSRNPKGCMKMFTSGLDSFIVRELGPGSMLLRTDIPDIYQIVPFHLTEHKLVATFAIPPPKKKPANQPGPKAEPKPKPKVEPEDIVKVEANANVEVEAKDEAKTHLDLSNRKPKVVLEALGVLNQKTLGSKQAGKVMELHLNPQHDMTYILRSLGKAYFWLQNGRKTEIHVHIFSGKKDNSSPEAFEAILQTCPYLQAPVIAKAMPEHSRVIVAPQTNWREYCFVIAPGEKVGSRIEPPRNINAKLDRKRDIQKILVKDPSIDQARFTNLRLDPKGYLYKKNETTSSSRNYVEAHELRESFDWDSDLLKGLQTEETKKKKISNGKRKRLARIAAGQPKRPKPYDKKKKGKRSQEGESKEIDRKSSF